MNTPGSSTALPFTRAGFVACFTAHLAGMGVPVERHLQRAKIPPDLLRCPEAPVPVSLAHLFLRSVSETEGIEDIGGAVGRATTLEDLGQFGKRLLGSRTVFEYLTSGIRLIPTVTSGDRYWLKAEGEYARFCFLHSAPGIPESDRQRGYLFTLVLTVDTLRRVAGKQWCPEEIRLPTLDQASSKALSDWVPRCRVITGDRHGSFLISRALLGRPMPPSSDASRHPEFTLLPALPDELSAAVEMLIGSLAVDGTPGIDTAAEAAGLSVRTLRRRLAESGTSYSDLVARTRMSLAEKWLAEGDRSITEIALASGYTDRSNFSRAFRQFYGISPREYRRAIVNGRML